MTGYLIETVGWRGACVAWALTHLVVCFPLVLFVVPEPGARNAQEKAARDAVAWDRGMVQLAVLFACAWFISSAMANHMPRLLAAIGLSPSAAAATAGFTAPT